MSASLRAHLDFHPTKVHQPSIRMMFANVLPQAKGLIVESTRVGAGTVTASALASADDERPSFRPGRVVVGGVVAGGHRRVVLEVAVRQGISAMSMG